MDLSHIIKTWRAVSIDLLKKFLFVFTLLMGFTQGLPSPLKVCNCLSLLLFLSNLLPVCSRAFLRCLAYMVSVTGHLLQSSSSYVQYCIGEDEHQHGNSLDSAS